MTSKPPIIFMKDKKLERALYGPSLWDVTLGAVLSIVLGGVAAVIFLVYKPVETVRELPKEDERVPGQVYFVEGSKDSAKARQWRTKRKQLADGTAGEIALVEDELNIWFAPEAPAKTPPAKEGEAIKEPIPDELITWDAPNFRIADGSLQIATHATFNPLRIVALDVPVVVQARGGFEKRGEEFVFAPKSLYLGSLPLHRIPGATSFVVNRAQKSAALPPQGLEVWKRVSDVNIDDRVLKIAIR